MSKALFDPWLIGDLRLTAFPVTPARGRQWEGLVGAKPETSHSKNFDNEVEESGPVEHLGILNYRGTQRAVEWMLSSPGTLLGPQVVEPFRTLMKKWLSMCPPLNRLAFGTALFQPVDDRAEAYRRLGSYLQWVPKYSDDEGDFAYQYNRRRQSQTLPQIKLNRLSKWSWVPLGEVHVQGGSLVATAGQACLLELDVNTMPEFEGTLPTQQLAVLFEELIELATEIAAKGDVP